MQLKNNTAVTLVVPNRRHTEIMVPLIEALREEQLCSAEAAASVHEKHGVGFVALPMPNTTNQHSCTAGLVS